MSRRVVASLLAIALLSGAVIAEAEQNYASVTSRDETSAGIADTNIENGALVADLRVNSSMNEPLRIQYVHLTVAHPGYNDSASTPFKGQRSLLPGENDLKVDIPARQVSGNLSAGDAVTVYGEIVVSVYNGYEFDIPVERTEVTL
ncbi:hypothetical protein [Haladaptatus pallidirubidus]|uniref:Uncharacterized protein n=1 Tax=Haladaptatus pallidirubidus TaxID=1008152 RepID=A0AAV3URV2_9EURY|nr:hypothetical protein [Haladaptatus pallidirubidus]